MKNTNKKIIFLISGLTFLIITIIGITYAYYSISITGNKSDAITFTSKAFLITYTDGKTSITGGNDGTTTTDLIYTKTFTIENTTPTGAYYEVAISNYKVEEDGVESSLERPEDWTYYIGTITDIDGDGEITGVDSPDTPTEFQETIAKGTFPEGDDILIPSRYLDSNEYETLALIVRYNYITEDEGGTDQTADMGKTLSFDVVVNQVDAPEGATGLLADAIINRAKLGLNGTTFVEGSQLGIVENTSVPAEEVSLETEAVLSTADDDYTATTGNPSYYFRGAVKNNYVEFNNMCWRIVRIEGDGSVKITLAKENLCSTLIFDDTSTAFIGEGYYGYTADYLADYENGKQAIPSMKDSFNEWFNGTLSDGTTKRFTNDIKELIKTSQICIGDTTTKYNITNVTNGWYYDNYIRLYTNKKPSLVCNLNGFSNNSYQVYPLTADEVIFAGGKVNGSASSYYLMDNARQWWLTLSPSSYQGDGRTFVVVASSSMLGKVDQGRVLYSGALRPTVSLKSGATLEETILGQNGTQEHPYVIAE